MAPAPAPYPAPAPAPYPTPAPAPYPQQRASAPAHPPIARAPYPAPAPAPITPSVQASDSSEEDETETEFSSQHESNDYVVPTPAPAPAPAPLPMPVPADPQPSNNSSHNGAFIGDSDHTTSPHEEEEAVDQKETVDEGFTAEPTLNGESHNLKAAADLIHTLDTAYAEANAATATTAWDADEARTAARTAAEIVRRYKTGSHPREGSDLTNTFDRDSPASSYRSGKSPTSFFGPTEQSSREIISVQTQAPTPSSTTHSIYFSKASPSNRLVASRTEDALALALELERVKQVLETERMAHDETKNALAEERAKNSHLQHKLERLQSSMETQRENLGRSGDVLEEELQRATLRMEAAEEDAQLALDFAKESEAEREKLEQLLEESMAEIQTLRQEQSAAIFGYGEVLPTIPQKDEEEEVDETPYKSILKPMQGGEDGTDKNRSVHFSDPISFSGSPIGDSFIDEQDEIIEKTVEEEHPQPQPQQHDEYGESAPLVVSTPNRPSRPMVSAGRKLLQQSTGKGNADNKTYSFEYTPEKSAERRQRLRDTLKEMDSAVVIASPLPREPSPQRKQLQFSTNVLELCRKVTEILQASGSRLELDGHWWREKKEDGSEEVELDSLARQYCQSVEVKTSRQKNEISELESLCSFLEESVASS